MTQYYTGAIIPLMQEILAISLTAQTFFGTRERTLPEVN
jgi:hypothetical protein